MKITGMLFLLAAAAFAQDAAQPSPSSPAVATAASPVPASEAWLSGYMELGYRFLPGIGGSEATYRSIVNLGEGPKLTGTDFTILDPKKRLFERLRVRAYDIGDPWATFHLFVEKRGIYKLLVDYRNLTYFNNLPSYADPTLSRGVILDQQSFDSRRHFGSYDLELFNGRFFSPYLIYDRDSSSGHGVSVFRSDGNEYPIPELFDDATNLYRVGAHFSLQRFHATVEQGHSQFRSDSNTNYTSNPANPGNNLNPILGQTLSLSTLYRATGVRGDGPYTRLTATASPFSWLDVYGHWMRAEPRNTAHFQQAATGSFVLLSQVLFYNSLQGAAGASARLPHTSANVGWELRPLRRLRVTQFWNTDHLTSSATASVIDNLLSVPLTLSTTTTSLLEVNESRLETNVFYEAPKSITLRGGHRAAWANTANFILPAAGLPGAAAGELHRQVGLGGITWRPGSRWSVSADSEVGRSTGTWFRTSLYDYEKVRATGRVQLLPTLRLSLDYRSLYNTNPYAGSSYKFNTNQESASLTWSPKKVDLEGTYEHCAYHSEIAYLVPQTLSPSVSVYREYCHTISGTATGSVPGPVKGQLIKFVAGGAFVITSGSRPTSYYQPLARVTVPVNKQIAFFAEWRYYGLGEAFYTYESFRAHLLTTGLRFTR